MLRMHASRDWMLELQAGVVVVRPTILTCAEEGAIVFNNFLTAMCLPVTTEGDNKDGRSTRSAYQSQPCGDIISRCIFVFKIRVSAIRYYDHQTV